MSLRRVARYGLFAAAGVLLVVVAIAVIAGIAFRLHPRATGPWVEFSIGPASGDSASIGLKQIRADGISLRTMIATAYEVPSVRVMGPPWLGWTRYSVQAVAPDAHVFRPMLRQELEKRFRLQTHVEPKPFDVFVLTATGAPGLADSVKPGPSTWIERRTARLRDASSERIAEALQLIVGAPVIDETGLRGSYDLALDWDDDPVRSLTVFLRDRFGLRLSPARRDLDVLVVDSVHRDPALFMLGHLGGMTRSAPPKLRHALAGFAVVR